ncbi:hypothetical protein AAMO2058_001440200, partial [Amorphochlora amoebiformis]
DIKKTPYHGSNSGSQQALATAMQYRVKFSALTFWAYARWFLSKHGWRFGRAPDVGRARWAGSPVAQVLTDSIRVQHQTITNGSYTISVDFETFHEGDTKTVTKSCTFAQAIEAAMVERFVLPLSIAQSKGKPRKLRLSAFSLPAYLAALIQANCLTLTKKTLSPSHKKRGRKNKKKSKNNSENSNISASTGRNSAVLSPLSVTSTLSSEGKKEGKGGGGEAKSPGSGENAALSRAEKVTPARAWYAMGIDKKDALIQRAINRADNQAKSGLFASQCTAQSLRRVAQRGLKLTLVEAVDAGIRRGIIELLSGLYQHELVECVKKESSTDKKKRKKPRRPPPGNPKSGHVPSPSSRDQTSSHASGRVVAGGIVQILLEKVHATAQARARKAIRAKKEAVISAREATGEVVRRAWGLVLQRQRRREHTKRKFVRRVVKKILNTVFKVIDKRHPPPPDIKKPCFFPSQTSPPFLPKNSENFSEIQSNPPYKGTPSRGRREGYAGGGGRASSIDSHRGRGRIRYGGGGEKNSSSASPILSRPTPQLDAWPSLATISGVDESASEAQSYFSLSGSEASEPLYIPQTTGITPRMPEEEGYEPKSRISVGGRENIGGGGRVGIFDKVTCGDFPTIWVARRFGSIRGKGRVVWPDMLKQANTSNPTSQMHMQYELKTHPSRQRAQSANFGGFVEREDPSQKHQSVTHAQISLKYGQYSSAYHFAKHAHLAHGTQSIRPNPHPNWRALPQARNLSPPPFRIPEGSQATIPRHLSFERGVIRRGGGGESWGGGRAYVLYPTRLERSMQAMMQGFCKLVSGRNQRAPTLISELHRDIVKIERFLTLLSQDHYPRQTNAITALSTKAPICGVNVFGSFATALCIPSSDIDLVICDVQPHYQRVLGQNDSSRPQRAFYTKLAEELRAQPWVHSVKALLATKMPILKVTAVMDGTRIPIDVTFDSPSHRGLSTRAFVRGLCSEYRELAPLTLVLKQFLVTKGLNDPYKGGLTSYGLVLMVVSVLQRDRLAQRYVAGLRAGPRFKSFIAKVGPGLRQYYRGEFAGRERDLGRLLLLFLDTFANRFNPKVQAVALPITRVEPALFAFMGGGHREKFRDHPLVLIDPLDSGNNIGRTCFNVGALQKAFAEALKSIQDQLNAKERKANRVTALIDTIFKSMPHQSVVEYARKFFGGSGETRSNELGLKKGFWREYERIVNRIIQSRISYLQSEIDGLKSMQAQLTARGRNMGEEPKSPGISSTLLENKLSPSTLLENKSLPAESESKEESSERVLGDDLPVTGRDSAGTREEKGRESGGDEKVPTVRSEAFFPTATGESCEISFSNQWISAIVTCVHPLYCEVSFRFQGHLCRRRILEEKQSKLLRRATNGTQSQTNFDKNFTNSGDSPTMLTSLDGVSPGSNGDGTVNNRSCGSAN